MTGPMIDSEESTAPDASVEGGANEEAHSFLDMIRSSNREQVFIFITSLAYIIFTLYNLTPVFERNKNHRAEQVKNSISLSSEIRVPSDSLLIFMNGPSSYFTAAYDSAMTSVEYRDQHQGHAYSHHELSVQLIKDYGLHPVNITVFVGIDFGVFEWYAVKEGRVLTAEAVQTFIRYDNLILLSGLWGGISIVLFWLLAGSYGAVSRVNSFSQNAGPRRGIEAELLPGNGTVDQQVFMAVQGNGHALHLPRMALGADEILANDADDAARRSDQLYSRSNILLAGGIIMAFVGVGVFYFSLPEVGSDETYQQYLPKVIRPTGMLIFIESIAWFLLRQYRALIEDYKAFHRIYLKRANYRVAQKMLTQSVPDVSQYSLLFAAALLQEDLTGRLKNGESTEGIEAGKIVEQNPVLEILRAMVERLPRTSTGG
jgi:hypothetical protein